ncbi:MAG: sigma-70 family RNA polymerase sigma factor [Gammaproteobacteria bacterium]|nr:sigma-70 family RNA polymerase sigma factor [Gammaproteobacteria bacterium]
MERQEDDGDSGLRRLMKAAQEGDRVSYDCLLRKLVPKVRNAVRVQRSYIRPVDIEDIVQDVLLSVHAVRATYSPERPFAPWLAAIVRNRVADSGRRYVRLKSAEQAAEGFYETFSPDETNTTNENGSEDGEALLHAIASLPAGQRRAVELVKLREMSLKEAAHESGMSVASLKVSVHRAIKALRTRLKKPE